VSTATLHAEQEDVMGKFRDRMDEELRIRGYSEHTRLCYLRRVRHLGRYFMAPPDQLTPEHVRQYQLFLARERHVSWTACNQTGCALRFFYRQVLRKDWAVEQIPYQRTGQTLPEILSPQEVSALLQATPNLKQRALLMTMYAAGLRVAEVTHLRVTDIDGQRMMICVEQGQGRQDRYVMLSPHLHALLQQSWGERRPTTLLFPGPHEGPLTCDRVTRVFHRARRAAQITKPVYPYSLRHACPTHLLEAGTNIRVIHTRLGHRSLRTTQRYTHVAATAGQDIPSPLDRLPELPRLSPRPSQGRGMSVPAARPAGVELADIIRAHAAPLIRLSRTQQRVLRALTDCRTAALGGHRRACPQ
jgi:integrase/recombinase XerD